MRKIRVIPIREKTGKVESKLSRVILMSLHLESPVARRVIKNVTLAR